MQKNPNKPFRMSVHELERYLGVCLMMDLVHLPSVRAYWDPDIDMMLCANVSPRIDLRKSISFMI